MTELPILGITADIISAAEARVYSTTDTSSYDDLAKFARSVNRRMNHEQPVLAEFFRNSAPILPVSDIVILGYSAALTYEMIPDHHRLVPLEETDTTSSFQSLKEHTTVITDTNGNNTSKINLDWLIASLDSDSPDYVEWLFNCAGSLDRHEDQITFLLGGSLTVAPFFRRIQAKRLHERFG